MQLRECYAAFGGDYDSVSDRIPKTEIIEMFLIKFLSEPSYGNLCEALENEKYEEAFRAAHSLKGVSANLGFKVLGKSSSDLTEYLREKSSNQIDSVKCKELLEKVSGDYRVVIDAIKEFRGPAD